MNAQMIRLKMMVVVCLQFVTGSLPAQLAGGFELTPNSGRQVQSQEVVITWPENNDELRGFSTKIGDWEILKIAPQVKIDPVAASNVAAVRFDDSIAAFSGEKGGWDVIELSTESKSFPACHPSLVVIEDNGHLYTFSAPTGRWTSPTDPELQEQNRTLEVRYPRTSSPTVFVDVNNRMKQFGTWRDSLPAYKRRGILLSVTSGASTGTATLSASRLSWMTELEAKVRELFDVIDPGEENGTSSDVNPDADSVQALEQRIEGLRTELSTLEQNVRSASQIPSGIKSETDQRHELRKLVEQSFDLRQQLQELEAQRLRVKLQQVENNLVVRAKVRDAIVDRRLRELINTPPSQEVSNNRADSDDAQESDGQEARPQASPTPEVISAPQPKLGSDPRIQWPQPTEIIKELRNLQGLATCYLSQSEGPKNDMAT